jgi:hypothetical protein
VAKTNPNAPSSNASGVNSVPLRERRLTCSAQTSQK